MTESQTVILGCAGRSPTREEVSFYRSESRRSRDTVLVRCPEAGGWRIFVPLAAGASHGAAVAGPDVVSRGEMVTITVRGAGFSLSRQGEAMEGGAVGEWIRVRPVDKKADPLRAQVLRPGLVGMELP